jgi:autotransporter-associated beta strand protein
LSGTGGTIDLGSGTLTAGDGTTSTFAGTIVGSGGLIKQGSGTLVLSGANTYTGGTVINAGVLAVNGSLTGNTIVNAGGMLQGTGTVGATTVNSGGALGASANGTLTMASLVQNAGSTFQVVQGSLVSVTGTATLNGGTVSALAPWSFSSGSYTILSAASRTGTFDGATSNRPFLAASLAYNGGTVTLTLTPNIVLAAQSAGVSANAFQVAFALAVPSSLINANHQQLEALVNANITPQEVPAVLDMLSGQTYSNWATTASQSMQTFVTAAQSLGGLGGGTAQPAATASAALSGSTYRALRIDGSDACETACDVEPLWGAWGGGMGAFGTVAGDGNAHGLTYSLGGFVAGLDRRFAPGVRAGIATGFNAASLYSNGVPGYGTSNTLQFALYGEYAPGPLYLDALAGYGHSDNRMNRPIVIPGLPFYLAQGHTTANTIFGQLEAGYKIPVAPSFGGFVIPFARLLASTSTQNGFSESGADGFDLTVAAQTTQSLRTVLGAQLGAAIDAPWREKLDVLFRLGWSHEYADLSRPVTAAFALAPAVSFTTFGAVAPRDGVVLGLGASTMVAERTSLYFRYDGDLAGGNTNHVLNAGVRYVW